MTAPEVIRLADFREFASDRHIAKLMHDSDKCRVVLFCLEAGQELSPHESASEVVFYGVEGDCHVLVGKDWLTLEPQTIVDCPPDIAHGLSCHKNSGHGRHYSAPIAIHQLRVLRVENRGS